MSSSYLLMLVNNSVCWSLESDNEPFLEIGSDSVEISSADMFMP